jgi:23S rRNA pseudouridine1911/1915/1917 synthase
MGLITSMAARVLRHVVTQTEDGRRLDEIVSARVAEALRQPPSRAAVRRLIMAGGVKTGGRALRSPGRPQRAGVRLEVRLEPDRLEPLRDAGSGWRLTPEAVLFADGVLLAVDKPPGLPTTPTADPARPSLVGAVRAYLASARPGSAPPYLGVHQRLDRDTSGLVLFATDPRANAGLARQFEDGEVEKTYVALTVRPKALPPPAWEVSGQLDARDRGRASRVTSVRSGGQRAQTRFRRLEAHPYGLVVQARPLTGRKHQIRAHLAEAGLPLLGDAAYGGPDRAGTLAVPRPMLHAARLRLRHPLSAEPLTIESALPADFERVLAALRHPSRAHRS